MPGQTIAGPDSVRDPGGHIVLDDLRVRRAAPTDDRQLATISYDAWSADTSLERLPQGAAPFFDRGGTAVASTLVAFSPQAVVGYAVVEPDNRDGDRAEASWSLRAVAVDRLFQNAGVGLTLVRAAIAAAGAAGAGHLTATVHRANARAIRLLTRCGFATADNGQPEAAGTATDHASVTMVLSPVRRPT